MFQQPEKLSPTCCLNKILDSGTGIAQEKVVTESVVCQNL